MSGAVAQWELARLAIVGAFKEGRIFETSNSCIKDFLDSIWEIVQSIFQRLRGIHPPVPASEQERTAFWKKKMLCICLRQGERNEQILRQSLKQIDPNECKVDRIAFLNFVGHESFFVFTDAADAPLGSSGFFRINSGEEEDPKIRKILFVALHEHDQPIKIDVGHLQYFSTQPRALEYCSSPNNRTCFLSERDGLALAQGRIPNSVRRILRTGV